MKFKILLLTICSFGALNSYAQKGVDTGTPFGSGEDSVRCIQNVSLFTQYAKSKNFQDALEYWQLAYAECPAATRDIYLYGVQIIRWQIDNETDAAKKAQLVNDMIALYDNRVKYFGNDPRYGKDWIAARKAKDYLEVMGANADFKMVYGWLKEAIDEFGDKTDFLVISYYMFASHQQLMADDNFKATYIEDYLKSAAILDKQIAAATSANNATLLGNLTNIKGTVENNFATSGAADCETLQSIYAGKIEENKDNIQYLRETIALLRRVRCNEIEAYFAAAEYAHRIEPTAESARGLGAQAHKRGDNESAIAFFEEAAELETDTEEKAQDYFRLAALQSERSNYARARQYALKALEINPNLGQAYILIGNMYGQSAKNIYPNDNLMQKLVYYAAVDKFERAKQVDPSVASEANRLINAYRANFPSKEEIFMHPDLSEGATITIPGWINERTTIR